MSRRLRRKMQTEPLMHVLAYDALILSIPGSFAEKNSILIFT